MGKGKLVIIILLLVLLLEVVQNLAGQSKQPAASTNTIYDIGASDVRITARKDSGYDLYIRKKPNIGSVLVTESTRDPALMAHSFAFRSETINEINGTEKRILDGKTLPQKVAGKEIYSLVSSTPIKDAEFGEAFHIFVPPTLVYGYPWSRSGTVSVGKGTFLNLRAFARPFADYGGPFKDNPFVIDLIDLPPVYTTQAAPEVPPPPPVQVVEPSPPKELPPSAKIENVIEQRQGTNLDLVIVLDTTQSMLPYINNLKKTLTNLLKDRSTQFDSFRVGLVLFKDYYPEEYITRKYPFVTNLDDFDKNLQAISVGGGGNLPEAVYEALYSAASEYDWKADVRQVILVTDAAPHPAPKGQVTLLEVAKVAKASNLEITYLIEPESPAAPIPVHFDLENIIKVSKEKNKATLIVISDFRTTGQEDYTQQDEADGIRDSIISRTNLASSLGTIKDITVLNPASKEDLQAARAIPSDSNYLALAAKAGASHLILRTSVRYASEASANTQAVRETLSRLLDVQTGVELSRDIAWVTESNFKSKSIFANGYRSR